MEEEHKIFPEILKLDFSIVVYIYKKKQGWF